MLCFADSIEDFETRPRSLSRLWYFFKGCFPFRFFHCAVLFSNIMPFLLCRFNIHERCSKLEPGIGSTFSIDIWSHPLWSSAPSPEPMVIIAKLTASPINSSDKRILPPPYYFDDSRVAQYEVIYQDQDNASQDEERRPRMDSMSQAGALWKLWKLWNMRNRRDLCYKESSTGMLRSSD